MGNVTHIMPVLQRIEEVIAGIVFTHESILPILGFFASQGRHVAPIRVKLGREVRSSLPNFTLIGLGVGVCGQQN